MEVAKEVRSSTTSVRGPNEIWRGVADFCAPWHPAVAEMSAESDAHGGLVRAFSVTGEDKVYRERLTYLSHTDREMAYSMVEGIEGASRYDARLSIAPHEEGCVITMSAAFEAAPDRAEAIAEGTKAIFDAGVKAIAALDAPARPCPAPVNAVPDIRAVEISGKPPLMASISGAPSDTLVLFLHGIGGGRENWRRQIAAVAPYAQAAALDLRGYGESRLGEAQSTVDDHCEDILRVTEAFGASRLILCGLSYGAWIATSFAMRHPGMLAGLVLSGGCTGMSEADKSTREAFRAARETPLDAGLTPADFAQDVLEIIAGPTATPDARAELRASMAAISADTYRDALRCFTNPPERFDFAKVAAPVLMLTGAHDRLAPPEEIRSVAGRIHAASARPDVRFEVIPEAGHVCNVEAPERYNEHLLEFIRRLVR